MPERTVRVAISITNPVAEQLAVTMFSTTGARVDVFENVAAILDIADSIQAIVLGLDAFPDETLDALTLVRERLAEIPTYVISAAGQRHAQRAQLHGATRVIPYGDLEQQIESLVQEIAESRGLSGAATHPPGWVPPNSDQGYDLASMDLNVWLSTPGNRRLLGMQEDPTNNRSSTASVQAAPRAPRRSPIRPHLTTATQALHRSQALPSTLTNTLKHRSPRPWRRQKPLTAQAFSRSLRHKRSTMKRTRRSPKTSCGASKTSDGNSNVNSYRLFPHKSPPARQS